MTLYGLGFRPKYYHRVVSEPTKVDFYEIISENFMGVGGRPRRYLSQLCEQYPVVMHGVGLGIAGVAPLRTDYLNALRTLIAQVKPRFVSDHLCWTTHAHKNSHDLLPVKFTEETLTLVSSRLKQIQDILGRRFFIENPSAYVAFAENDCDEATFLAELVQRSGCGILLDVNNLFVNVSNLGYDAVDYLKKIPKDSVGYFHLAGHSVCPDVRIDTHDAPVCDQVWTIYKLAARLFPCALTLLERDDNYPPFDELEAELALAKKTRDAALTSSYDALETEIHAGLPQPLFQELRSSRMSWSDTATEMFGMVEQVSNLTSDDVRLELFDSNRPVSKVRGINVYNNAYFFRLRDCIASDLATVEGLLGTARFSNMIASYILACPSSHYDVKWAGAKLPIWLRESATTWCETWSNAALADLVALELKRSAMYGAPDGSPSLSSIALAQISTEEWDSAVFRFRPCASVLSTSHDIWDAWLEASQGSSPLSVPVAVDCDYLVYRNGEEVFHERLDPAEARLFKALAEGNGFAAACAAFADVAEIDSTTVQTVISHLMHWFDNNLIEAIETK